MIFLNRSRKRSLKHLEWRVRAFVAGALLGLVGIALRLSWLVYIAIAVLALGVALRFLEGPLEEGDSNSHPNDVEEGPHAP